MMEYPLYGSTLTLYRASPLYHGGEHVFDNLDLHARRMREHLAGARARSLLLTDLQPEIAGTGVLETCQWTLLADEATWEQQQDSDKDIHVSKKEARGLQIQLKFERAKYTAILLGDRPRSSKTPAFTSLPLLLLRMPITLRELFLDFMATSFDTNIKPMKLRSSFLSSSLEGLLQQTTAAEDEDPALDLETLSKGIGLQLSFPSVTPYLRSLDLVIAKDDIRDFQREGKVLWEQRQARQQQQQQQIDKGRDTRRDSNIAGPFSAALSTYLSNHISMELDNPVIVLSKVALGPFAISGEGKVKILAPSTASVRFWEDLIDEAYGEELSDARQTTKPSNNTAAQTGAKEHRTKGRVQRPTAAT